MITFVSTLPTAMHRRPRTGFGGMIVRFGCEGFYGLSGVKSLSQGILEAIGPWSNPDRRLQLQSGRCRVTLAPT